VKNRTVIKSTTTFLFTTLYVCTLAGAFPAQAQAHRIIFLHHSVGQNLIEQGNVREGLTKLGYEFYDHGYNDGGLRLADGTYTGTNFDVPGDNTDPDGFAEIFAQPLHDPPDNTFSHLMEYDVIIFKSCFPNSNIESDEQLAQYQAYYLSIRDRMDQYPNKLFILLTIPPEVPGNSEAQAVARARTFANWLQSTEYLSGHPNVRVFDFFDLLSGQDNFLRSDYRFDNYDGHPNEQANRDIGPIFIDFVDQAIRSYQPGIAPSPPASDETDQSEVEEAEPTAQPQETIGVVPTTLLIDDFENGEAFWEVFVDEVGSTVECRNVSGNAHSGSGYLQFQYQLQAGGSEGCGRSYNSHQNWSAGTGISMWVNSEQIGQWATLSLFAGNPLDATPFEVHFEVSTGGWSQIRFFWADFQRAEWASETGLQELEPTQITGLAFSFSTDEGHTTNTFSVDDIYLVSMDSEVLSEEDISGTIEEGQSLSEDPSESESFEEQLAVEEETPEDEEGNGLCPLSTMALPMVALILYLARKKR
jgi:hypothetical protein